jgi:hypothetical protein
MSSPQRAAIASLITGCWSTQVIHAAVSLGIPDRLATGVSNSTELARLTGTQPRAMRRLLRALAALDLLEQLAEDEFRLTASGDFLRTDAPDSLAILARHWGARTWPALSHLPDALKSGKPWSLGGREGFQSMAHRPEDAAIFNRSMVSQTLMVARAIIDAYDFSAFRSVIDVGGGYGALLSVLLKAYPQLRGASADLAYMEPEALAFLREAGVADRSLFIPTDFFRSIEPNADAYLLKFIIHDWDDADSIEILRNTRIAAGAAGIVLIIEQVAPERVTPTPESRTIMRGDIHMMVATGGMERTAAEYRALLDHAGLELARIVPTASDFSLIEARPRG